MGKYDLPCERLLIEQAEWLAPARARVLRKIGVGRRCKVLDLGCGFGAVTGELMRRSGGMVAALDCRYEALAKNPQSFAGAGRVCGDALRLPFADGIFDLVFCQFALLWIDAVSAVREIYRVLRSDGVLAAIEPDYGGMMEFPAEIAAREIWISALTRAGADPFIGRKLPGVLRRTGWKIEVDLLDRLVPPLPDRFALLEELPLTDGEKTALEKVKSADAALDESAKAAHLPMFIVSGERMA